jgi:hypothetical protein
VSTGLYCSVLCLIGIDISEESYDSIFRLKTLSIHQNRQPNSKNTVIFSLRFLIKSRKKYKENG